MSMVVEILHLCELSSCMYAVLFCPASLRMHYATAECVNYLVHLNT